MLKLLKEIFCNSIGQTSKVRFDLAIIGSQNGLWDWNIKTDEVFYSPRFRELIGYTEDDIEGFPNTLDCFEEHLHPKDRRRTLRAILDHVEYNIPFDVEFRLRNKNGFYKYFRSKGQAFYKNDTAYRMCGSIVDISDQKEFEKALIKEKQYTEHIVKCNPALILSFSSLGITRYVNPMVSIVTGYTEEELIGGNWLQMCFPEKTNEDINNIMSLFSSEAPVKDYELTLTTKTKETRIVSWNSINQYDEIGELEEVILFGIDVTQRHKFEKDLIQAKEAAESANHAKSDFLAGMSHEIRTPMNGVMGTTALLAETELDEKQKKYVNIITKSGHTLLEIINEILDYSKIESGKLKICESAFCLRDAIENQVSLLQPLAQEKDIKYTLQYDEALPELILSDDIRIRQILTNLIGNAIKFTAEGGAITIKAQTCDLPPNTILFTVKDTGIGIPEDKLDTVFQAFEQIVESRKQAKTHGTGLGLAICKRLCEMMDGSIGVTSKIRQGSTFWFSIPLKKPNQKQIDTYNNQQTNAKLEAYFNAHILVVEDVLTNQFVITNMLENMGCTVDLAKNGQESVDMVPQNDYDLIFMDCNMPVMDGFEATQNIRKLDIKQPPIVALTANALENDRKKCMAVGMDHFITKPVDKNDIIDALQTYTNTLVEKDTQKEATS